MGSMGGSEPRVLGTGADNDRHPRFAMVDQM